MSVTIRGNSFQAIVTHNGKRYRRQFPNKQEAVLWENESKVLLLKVSSQL